MPKEDRELLILVGMPGSGKTYYCQHFLGDHARISQDEGPRRFEGIVRKLRGMLTEGVRAIVMDRTNPGREQRKTFAEMARAAGYRVKIIHFDIPEQVCEKRIRRRKGHPTLGADRMAEAIAAYQRNFEPPSADECDDLLVVPA
jgi:predicted kinase